jgi:hypothetical protein
VSALAFDAVSGEIGIPSNPANREGLSAGEIWKREEQP